MSYLNYQEIQELIDQGVIKKTNKRFVNTASLDIRIQDTIIVEEPVSWLKVLWSKLKLLWWVLFDKHEHTKPVEANEIVYRARGRFRHRTIKIGPDGFTFKPGTFILGASIERFDIPDDIAALLRTKSSMGRSGFEHMDAGWVDPGFRGHLTLEYQNNLKHHSIRIYPGDRVGQLIFLRGKPVDPKHSYRANGNYNDQTGVAMAGFDGEAIRLRG
jgi:deoxycytidine triphosphate deaminase